VKAGRGAIDRTMDLIEQTVLKGSR
jgi:hypothetical protein